MRLTQCLIFELSPICNLGEAHRAACPNRSPERWAGIVPGAMLSDDRIVEIATAMHRDYGFRGFVGWHYYNEPLATIGRMFSLMLRIRDEVPVSRFLLWTNGLLLPEAWPWRVDFDLAYVTWYPGHPPANLDVLRDNCLDVRVVPANFDRRLAAPSEGDLSPCTRMLFEFAIDCYGFVHPCCWAWRGRDTIGNVITEPLGDVVARWQETRRLSIAGPVPDACRRCGQRFRAVNSIDDRIGRDAGEWMREVRHANSRAA